MQEKIVYKKLKDLKEYKNNARQIGDDAIEAVAKSIKEFGFRNPILVDKNNTIIAGHTRLLASKKLKLEEAPCIVVDDLTEEQVNALRLADNKTAEYSCWDFEKLHEELQTFENFEIQMFDFDPEEDFIKVEVEEPEVQEQEDKKTHKCPQCGFEW